MSLNPYLRYHEPIIRHLGIDGMSSDESDREEHEELARANALTDDKIYPRYTIRVPRWRADELSPWLHDIDMVNIENRANMGTFRGSLPRLREAPAGGPIPSTNYTFVPGLPVNAYKRTWLQRMDPHVVEVKPQAYNFTHDSRLHG